MARLGFAPGTETAVIALGLGPVGWVAAGFVTALAFIDWFTPARGNFQKFDREMLPTLKSLTDRTGLESITGWFNELVGVDQAGNRKVYGSWKGMGPEWGDLAAAKIMDLGRNNFLWSFAPGSDKPWILVGPHQTLGSVVYISLETLQAIVDWWGTEEARIIREGPQPLEGPEPEAPPIEPSYEPIDPGTVSPPPDPAAPVPIDPPVSGTPRLPGPSPRPWWLPRIPGLPGWGGGPGPGPEYPPGGYPGGPGSPGAGLDNNWLYYGAAGLLLLAALQKKKKRRGASHVTKKS